jgi:hypothetical protein
MVNRASYSSGLGREVSNSEMSWQNIPLKGRIEFWLLETIRVLSCGALRWQDLPRFCPRAFVIVEGSGVVSFREGSEIY